MTFVRSKASAYLTREKLPSSAPTLWDTQFQNALDGAAGGTYAPSAAIIINGSGMQFGAIPALTSQSVTRIQALRPIDKNSWTWSTNAGAWVQNASADYLWIPLNDIPDHSSLVSVRIMLNAAAGDGGAYTGSLPTVMPTLSVQYVNNSGVVGGTGTPTTDASGSLAAFNAAHSITFTLSSPLAVDMGSARQAIYALINGVGTGYQANKLGILQLDAVFTVTKVNA
jgi:hypothetical protein